MRKPRLRTVHAVFGWLDTCKLCINAGLSSMHLGIHTYFAFNNDEAEMSRNLEVLSENPAVEITQWTILFFLHSTPKVYCIYSK